MIYALTKTRKDTPDCYTCNKLITKSEEAYTSGKRKFCFSCGRMENQYHDVGMLRPAGNC